MSTPHWETILAEEKFQLLQENPNRWQKYYYAVETTAEKWPSLAAKLKNNGVESLLNLTVYDLRQTKNVFRLSYELRSYIHGVELRISYNIGPEEKCYSVSHIYPSAQWHEREAYDMMGIVFIGHPALRRIFLPEDWLGYPLRKDYIFPQTYRDIPLT